LELTKIDCTMTKKDIQDIKDAFEKIKEKFKSVYDFEYINGKVPDVRLLMLKELNHKNDIIIQQVKELKGNYAYISIELNDWIAILKKSVELNSNSTNSVRQKLSYALNELIDGLKEYHLELTESPLSSKDINNIFANIDVGVHNKPLITTKQLIILMDLLKRNRIIIKDIEQTRLAVCFGGLTGFKADNLRKDYNEYKQEEKVHSINDINTLKQILINMNEQLSMLEVK
jgi:hypothetical protein